MKILFAADGSAYTKRALGFLVTHDNLVEGDGEVVVLNVQLPLPAQIKRMLGAEAVSEFYQTEANKVLAPIQKFLARHKINARTEWQLGKPAEQIINTSHREQAHLIMMGTHGHGLIGRALMGSVAQRVLVESELPVFLVK